MERLHYFVSQTLRVKTVITTINTRWLVSNRVTRVHVATKCAAHMLATDQGGVEADDPEQKAWPGWHDPRGPATLRRGEWQPQHGGR